jgi:hypothetical protein
MKKFEHPALDEVLVVPHHFEVCPTCEGHGTHFRSDLDENDLLRSMYEDGDEDGIENYRQGIFDQVCSECKGKRVIEVPHLPDWAQEKIDEWNLDEWESKRYAAMERRMGA